MNTRVHYTAGAEVTRGYVRRIGLYLGEMFPVPVRAVSSVLLFLSFSSILARIHGTGTGMVSWMALTGSAGVFLLLLTLRLMDELKDRDIDAALFRERPLPSGRVLESDIRFSILLSVSLYLAVNAIFPAGFVAAAVTMGYAFLMFRFFFVPRLIRNSLPLALATHNPIVGLMLGTCAVVFASARGVPPAALAGTETVLLVAMYWAMSFAWEISRKIRSEEEENTYVTYSRILGRTGAVAVSAGAQTVTAGIGLYFSRTLGFSVLYDVLILAAYGLVMSAYVRFLVRPDARTSKLRPWSELFMIGVMAAGFLEGVLS